MIKEFKIPEELAKYETEIKKAGEKHIWKDGEIYRVYSGVDLPPAPTEEEG